MRDINIPVGQAVLIIFGILALVIGVLVLTFFLGKLIGIGAAFAIVMAVFVFADVASVEKRNAVPAINLPATLRITSPFEKNGGHFETKIRLDGETWKATIPDDGGPIPEIGDTVDVIDRRGLEIRLGRTRDDA